MWIIQTEKIKNVYLNITMMELGCRLNYQLLFRKINLHYLRQGA